jgi:hypothetical protein
MAELAAAHVQLLYDGLVRAGFTPAEAAAILQPAEL